MTKRPRLGLPNPQLAPEELKRGDVVTGRVPRMEDLNEPGDKPRPFVVWNYCKRTGYSQGFYVTRMKNTSNTGGVEVSSPEDMKAAGFDDESRIVVKRLQHLKNDRKNTWYHPEKGAKIGELSPNSMRELEELVKDTWGMKLLVGDESVTLLLPSLLALARGWLRSVQGLSLEDSGTCLTLRLSDGLAVDFWPEDPDNPEHFPRDDMVTREMVAADPFLTGHNRRTILDRMAGNDRQAS